MNKEEFYQKHSDKTNQVKQVAFLYDLAELLETYKKEILKEEGVPNLELCPFCGSSAKLHPNYKTPNGVYYKCACTNDACFMSDQWFFIQDWNHRPLF